MKKCDHGAVKVHVSYHISSICRFKTFEMNNSFKFSETLHQTFALAYYSIVQCRYAFPCQFLPEVNVDY